MHPEWNIDFVETIANDAVLGKRFRYGIVYDDRWNTNSICLLLFVFANIDLCSNQHPFSCMLFAFLLPQHRIPFPIWGYANVFAPVWSKNRIYACLASVRRMYRMNSEFVRTSCLRRTAHQLARYKCVCARNVFARDWYDLEDENTLTLGRCVPYIACLLQTVTNFDLFDRYGTLDLAWISETRPSTVRRILIMVNFPEFLFIISGQSVTPSMLTRNASIGDCQEFDFYKISVWFRFRSTARSGGVTSATRNPRVWKQT